MIFVPAYSKNITGTEVLGVPLIVKGISDGNKRNNILARGRGGCRKMDNFTPNTFPFTCTVKFSNSVTAVDVKDMFLSKPRFDIATGKKSSISIERRIFPPISFAP